MHPTLRPALVLVAIALGLGALGDGLLRATPWGINAGLFLGALVIAAAGVACIRRQPGEGAPALLVALVFALALAWRDAAWLRTLDVAGAGLSLGGALLGSRTPSDPEAAVRERLSAALIAAVGPLLGFAPVIRQDVAWAEIEPGRFTRAAAAAGRGVAIAAPLLAIFGGLLIAADASFQRYATHVTALDLSGASSHLLLAGGCAWLCAGFLRSVGAPPRGRHPSGRSGPQLGLGAVEIGLALGLLDALFISFVAVQSRYLFGGAGFVSAAGGPTYSAYARRGFFELVIVASLTLPLLLAALGLLRVRGVGARRVCQILAALMVALVLTIMLSAVQRMALYVREYGLTELRLYTTAFMLLLAAVFVAFSATALRGRYRGFGRCCVLAALIVVAGLHMLNPDALMARVNLAVARDGVAFDVPYAAGLSADAVPTLLGEIGALPPAPRCSLAKALVARWATGADDWRAWNLARQQARRTTERGSALIRRAGC